VNKRPSSPKKYKQVLSGKINNATITYCNPNYIGSIQIDYELMEAVGFEDGELVHIWAVNHSARIQTYAFKGPQGTIGLNGGAAHQFNEGDIVTITSFVMSDEKIEPRILSLLPNNKIDHKYTLTDPFYARLENTYLSSVNMKTSERQPDYYDTLLEGLLPELKLAKNGLTDQNLYEYAARHSLSRKKRDTFILMGLRRQVLWLHNSKYFSKENFEKIKNGFAY
jgi:aspartate 1-decarboxylase